MLGLSDDAAHAAPAVERPIPEVAEHPRRHPGGHVPPPGLGELRGQCRFQAGIARQPEHVIDPVLLAPQHQRVVREATVGAQDDADLRPLPADLGDDAGDLLDRPLAAGGVRPPLPGQQQVATAEHVERQVAVLVIIAVEEAAFLPAVKRNVGVVEIEHDLAWRTLVRLEIKLDQQSIDL
jgi:hypothetical protein